MSTAAELDEPSPDEAAAPPAQAGRMPLFLFVRGLVLLTVVVGLVFFINTIVLFHLLK